MTLNPPLPPAQTPPPSPPAAPPPGAAPPSAATRPRRPRRGRRLLVALAAAAAVGGLAAAAVKFDLTPQKLLPGYFQSARADLVTHTVKPAFLPVTVVERGTLESAENKEVTCKVKAGSKGTYASTIRWVIDDGTLVNKNQLLMELDDSALQDSYRAQSIVVEKAKADWVTADENFAITVKQNQSDIATADAAEDVAGLELDKFLGLRADPALDPVGGAAGPLATLVEKGDYQRRLDEAGGALKIAEADLEQYRDRAAWSERSVRLGYQTSSQARAEQSKLSGSIENVEKLRKQKAVLEGFDRRKELTLLTSNLQVAQLKFEQAVRQARAKEIQAESTRKTAYSVYMQETEKLREIDEQIRQCKIYCPQDGMCVYYKEAGRWGSNNEGMIQQGAQVKEGQKLLRIPDLKRMQVNTRVHEAMVSRIRGDDRQNTGYFDAVRVGLLANPHPWSRLVAHSEAAQGYLREQSRGDEYRLASPGQEAAIRIDAFPDRTLKGHVRVVAAVASQQDWMSSDVKVYQTLVTIDPDQIDGLKPDMSAEVTINVDPPKDPVLAVPVQAVVGGAEGGAKRKVWVVTPGGPAERDVVLGLFNDKMVEVREGLAEGEQVVLNPKVLLGPGAKTRDESAEPSRRPGMGGAGGKADGKKGGEGKKGGGGPKGGPPAMKQ